MVNNILKSRVFGNTAIYTIANVLNGAIPFLLLPLLTRIFTPEEYGLVTLITAIITLFGVFTGLSVHGAVSVKYFDSTVNNSKFVGSCLLILSASTSIILIFVLIFGSDLAEKLEMPKGWIIIGVITSATQFIINIRLTLWQVKENAINYGVFQVFQTLLNFCASLFLVLIISMGWQGRIGGIVLATFVCAFLALFSLAKNKEFKLNFNPEYIKQALSFGLPLMPHIIGGLALTIVNRPIISNLIGNEQLGKFYVGMQMAMAIPMLSQALLSAYLPTLYRNLSKEDIPIKRKIVLDTYYSFLVLVVISVVYYILLPLVYKFFIGDKFLDTLNISRIMIFGYLFEGMYLIIAGFFYYFKRTGLLSLITFSVGSLGLLLQFFLTKNFGLFGAAYSFVIIYLVYFLTCWISISKLTRLPWISFLNINRNLKI